MIESDIGGLLLAHVKQLTVREEATIRQHWDGYPHQPGTLYDCPDCESQCFCDGQDWCLFCCEFNDAVYDREEC